MLEAMLLEAGEEEDEVIEDEEETAVALIVTADVIVHIEIRLGVCSATAVSQCSPKFRFLPMNERSFS